ncbi:hypothetical protein FACS189452_00070 [Bacteroidia bacterium]|nr:hypothetical protein FACS189452_00070 [Bacteroidia bacterium]GHT80138.1 hypothetical protein FACS189467_1480 [Bacteroidia bacterium]
MKKILTLSVMLTIGFTQVNAQPKLAFSKGFKANAAVSNFRMENTERKSNAGFGCSFGSSDKLEIGEYFALQGELLFRYGSSGMSDATTATEHTLQYWNVEVPVYFVGQLKNRWGKVFLGIGSYMGYGLSAKSHPGNLNLYKRDATTGKIPLSRWDFGAAAMLGYEFANGIYIDAACLMGFADLLNSSIDATMKSQVFTLGIGYRFQLFSLKLDKNKIIYEGIF